MAESAGPLAGLKVVELWTLIAGPYCARLMAEFGADVVKIEAPGEGDPLRKWRKLHEGNSLWWYAQARNKRSVAVNLRDPEGQDIVRRLARQADIVVENFRPGAMEKWNLDYERLREVKNVLGGTINDVVLSAVAGGLHELLDARGEPTKGRTLRVMVPVSVRSKAEQGDVGNRVAPAFVDVPVGAMSPRTRMRRVRSFTNQLKESTMAVSADSIIGLGAYSPPALHAMAARLVSRGRWFNLVVSNVPAPQTPLYLAGAPLVASYPAMPLGEKCGLSIACTSLAGTMAFGLTGDWDSTPDIDVLARGIETSIDELEKAAASVTPRRRSPRLR